MKKTLAMLTLLASVMVASSAWGAVKKHSLSAASSLKSDSPPTVVSPWSGDMPLLRWFWRFIDKEPNLEEQARPRTPYVPYDPPGE